MPRLLTIWLIVMLSWVKVWAKPVELYTEVSRPYQSVDDGELNGTVVDTVRCILENMNMGYRIKLSPWKRASQSLKMGSVDGFFSSTYNQVLSNSATLTYPLVLEKWYWLYTGDTPNFDMLGVVHGSTQDAWLSGQASFDIIVRANDAAHLINLLLKGRIEVMALDINSFNSEIASGLYAKERVSQINAKFLKYSALGVYFNNEFVSENTGFLDRFNSYIPACSSVSYSLDKKEQLALDQFARQKLVPLSNNGLVHQALKDGNQNEHNHKNNSFNMLMSNELSQHLIDIQQQSQGIISEIMIFDASGYNVAQSVETSDVWQGDEAKYLKLLTGINIFIDDIQYDPSTNLFQSQISIPIREYQTGRFIGGMTVGVNLEQFFQHDISLMDENVF
ncbi:transporter substrate-binding domain-containing protein [Vibrio sp. M260118]|uniref:transporter substrate-binding domain-containing protein n=1 Tax=Vibrio sp. M260118 TaxID=3020896 RepID=UPI002F3F3BB3